MRQCKRCGIIFNSISKRGKVCDDCRIYPKYKPNYNHKTIKTDKGYYYLVPSITYKKMVGEVAEYRKIKFNRVKEDA